MKPSGDYQNALLRAQALSAVSICRSAYRTLERNADLQSTLVKDSTSDSTAIQRSAGFFKPIQVQN
eukprot:708287-Prorocentrum_minimum.AAC.7